MRTIVWDILFGLLFALALFVFLKSPMKRKVAAPDWVDPVLGFIITLFAVTYFYVVHYSINLVPESDTAPCGRLSKQIQCYNLSQETCMVAWQSSSGGCEDKLQEIRKQRPTALMGTFLETCIGQNFDKLMHYNRKNLQDPSCQAYFQKVDNRK